MLFRTRQASMLEVKYSAYCGGWTGGAWTGALPNISSAYFGGGRGHFLTLVPPIAGGGRGHFLTLVLPVSGGGRGHFLTLVPPVVGGGRGHCEHPLSLRLI